jgi:hypothetical protein
MGKYSGNFVRTLATDKDIHPHYPTAAHAGGGTGDVRPQLDSRTVPVSTDYLGTEMPSYDVVGGGFELWHPLDTHDSEGVTYPLYTDDQQLQTIAEVHSDPNSQHGDVRAQYIAPLLQGSEQVYADTYRESFRPQPANPAVLERGREAWGLARNYGEVSPRLGMERQFTSSFLRHQNRRSYRYTPQVLTQRDAGVTTSRSLQRESLGSQIAGWIPQGSLHKTQRPGVWSDPGIVDESILAVDHDAGYEPNQFGRF